MNESAFPAENSALTPSRLRHDCNAELAVILSAAEALQRYSASWDAEKNRRYLDKIVKSALGLRDLLGGIRD